MERLTSVLISVLVLFSVVISVYGMSCYQCDSTHDADCKEFFDHEHKDTITVRSTECTVDAAKYCIKTTGVWGGVVGTTRFCSSRDMGNQCQFIRYPDHDRVYRACIYTCRGNHCNGAPHKALSPSLLLVTMFVIGLFAFRDDRFYA